MEKHTHSIHPLHPSGHRNRYRIVDLTLDFFRLEAAGGILLVLASAVALIIANSPAYVHYNYIFNMVDFRIGFSDHVGGDFELKKSLLHWINDGLMVVFFFLVGLEIKRELVVGELASRAKALLPLMAATGGMVVPALIYWFINRDNPEGIRGWAIPTATDIAFALAVLAVLGSRVPIALKVLFTAGAILDDLGAIIVIALFYTDSTNFQVLALALLPLIGLFMLNRRGVVRIAPYILLGILLWVLVLKSGIHATVAGVLCAVFIPVRVPGEERSPCQRLEHDLHPWVAFLILPIFGFANAGVPFGGITWHSLLEPVTLGIIAGLVVGKQIGIFLGVFLSVKSGLSPKPEGVTWFQIYGMAVVTGIGFTMSLFIGGLAFDSIDMQAAVRLGILVGSLTSAVAGYLLLRVAGDRMLSAKEAAGNLR